MLVITYTSVFGGYDTLQPARFPGVCVTDEPGQVPGWEYQEILMPASDKYKNRWCKMHPHILFPIADATIYVDGNIEVLVDPEVLVEKYLKDEDIAVFPHPERNCVFDEAAAVVELGKGDERKVNKHLRFLKQQGYPRERGLAACWVIIRSSRRRIALLNELWWEEFLRSNTGRDQLTFNYACHKLGIEYAEIEGNLFAGTSKEFVRSKHVRS